MHWMRSEGFEFCLFRIWVLDLIDQKRKSLESGCKQRPSECRTRGRSKATGYDSAEFERAMRGALSLMESGDHVGGLSAF